MLFKYGKSGSHLCSYCNLKDETPYHLFYECKSYEFFMEPNPSFFIQKSAIFCLINQKEKPLIINHLLFIFKFYTCNSRSSGKLNIEYLKILYTKQEILS